jgi:hypothetical protein
MAYKASKNNCKLVRDDEDYTGKVLVVEGDNPDSIVFHLQDTFTDEQVWAVFSLVQKAVSFGHRNGEKDKAAEIRKALLIE